MLVEAAHGRPVGEGRVRYHADNVTVRVAIDDELRTQVRGSIDRAAYCANRSNGRRSPTTIVCARVVHSRRYAYPKRRDSALETEMTVTSSGCCPTSRRPNHPRDRERRRGGTVRHQIVIRGRDRKTFPFRSPRWARSSSMDTRRSRHRRCRCAPNAALECTGCHSAATRSGRSHRPCRVPNATSGNSVRSPMRSEPSISHDVS